MRSKSGNQYHLSHSELQQLDLLKRRSPAERFLLMAGLIEEQIEVMKAGIRYKNPNFDGKEVMRCLKERMIKIYSWKH
jgi:hypothetical protein